MLTATNNSTNILNKMLLKEICEINLGYSFRGVIPFDPKGNYCVIQAKNILNDDLSELDKVSLEMLNERVVLKEGDVLLTNRCRFVAKTYFPEKKGACIAASSVFILRTRDNSCSPEYLTAYINSSEGQKQIAKFIETMTIPSLIKENIENLVIPMLPIKNQAEIVCLAKDFKEYSKLITKKLTLEERIINQFINTNLRLKGAM